MSTRCRSGAKVFRCGSVGGLKAYHSVSQGVDGCMNTRSAVAELFVVGGGNNIWRSTELKLRRLDVR
jgi:hypothetical protein